METIEERYKALETIYKSVSNELKEMGLDLVRCESKLYYIVEKFEEQKFNNELLMECVENYSKEKYGSIARNCLKKIKLQKDKNERYFKQFLTELYWIDYNKVTEAFEHNKQK